MKKRNVRFIVKLGRLDALFRTLTFSIVVLSGLTTMPSGAQTKTAAKAAETGPPAEVQAFVPAKWEGESFAYGDLGGGSKKDLALITALNPQHAFGDAKDRELVVAIRQKDGKLKKVTAGKNCLQLGTGPSGGDPEVSIKRGSIFLEASGGSRERFTESYQYKNMNDRWPLIGYSSKVFDSVDPQGSIVTIDVNLLTGRVEGSISSDRAKTKNDFFYELFALAAVNAEKEINNASDLHLSRAENVCDGTKLWQGASDCSALVRAVHTDHKLTIRATVSDNSVTDKDKVWLADEKGKAMTPTSSHIDKSDSGYTQTLSYKIAASNPDVDIAGMNRIRRWTVYIDDIDDKRPELVRLSTKLPGSSHPARGGVLLMLGKSMPTIETANARDGEFQAQVIEPEQ